MEWTNGGRYAKRCKLRFNAREAANQDSSWKQDRHPECQCRTIPQTGCGKASTPRRCLAFHLGSSTSGSHLTGSPDLGKQRPVYLPGWYVSPCPRSTVLAIKSLKPARHRRAGMVQRFRDLIPPMVDPSRRTHGRQSTRRHPFQPRKSQPPGHQMLPAVSIHGSDVRRVLAIFPQPTGG